MKKRLLCLFLCLVTMLSPFFASCSKKTDEEASEDLSEKASENAITLSMWVVSEEPVSEKDQKLISETINSISKANFKIELHLTFHTEADYRNELEKTISAYVAAKNNKENTEPETEATEGTGETEIVTDELVTDDIGLSVIDYPDLLPNQVDIVYIAGKDMYTDFVNNGWLSVLNTELTTTAKKLHEYIPANLLSAVKVGNSTYAIPNNHIMGEYTYMMVNKELAEKYKQTAYLRTGAMDGFFNEYLYNFVNMVNEFGGEEIPIDGTYEECRELLAHYWSFDSDTYQKLDEFSIFGSHYKSIEELERGSVILGYKSLFEDPEFAEAYLQLNQFKFGNYFGESSAETPAAVKLVKATSDVLSYNKDEEAFEYVDENGVAYYPVVVKYPTIDEYDVYGNMFGVCQYTRSLSRSMDIITYLNTNADFRNILQYGVDMASIDKNADDKYTTEEERPTAYYEVIEDEDGNKLAKPIENCEYKISPESAGNVFISYPAYNMSASIWENGMKQNRDALVNPMLDFDFADYAASTAEAEKAVSVPSDPGYVLSVSSGYSKDAFMENATLNAWITACDAAGKGIYVLPTEVTETQNRTIKYYVYNNSITSDVTFSVEADRKTEEYVNNRGKVEIRQTDLDFYFTYQPVSGGKASNYELSVVDLYTKKSNVFELKGKVGSSEAALTVDTAKALLKIDPYQTENYQIDVYNQVSRHVFRKNALVTEWLEQCDTLSAGNLAAFALVHTQEKGDKVEYTVVLYRDSMAYATNAKIIPSGDGQNLEIVFDLTTTATMIENEIDYLLTYVCVTADKGTEFSYSVWCDGSSESIPAENQTEAAEAPDFTMIGKLDTELVKYLNQVNADVLAMLDACQTYAELETLVQGLQALLVTGGGIDLSGLTEEETLAITPLLDKYDVGVLAEYLKAAVATQTTPELDADNNPVKEYGEEYVYFDSPNTLYYQWLNANKFNPEATQK